MKKTIAIILSLTITDVCFGQKDSIPPIADSVKFISKNHVFVAYKNLVERLKGLEDKLTVSQYNKLAEGIQSAFNEVIMVATDEYNKKKGAKK